jgi:hypothetical protein
MVSVKRQIEKILEQLPDDCSVEEVQYHLYVVEKIRRRLEMADLEDFVPQSEVEERMKKWLIE